MDVFGAMAVLRPPRKLYRVSEIAECAGVTRQTIHNYATIGLIVEEERTPGGQRLYDESVFATLGRIQRLKATHRLTEIRRILERQPGAGPAAAPVETAAFLAAGGPATADDARGPSPARANMRNDQGPDDPGRRTAGAPGAPSGEPAARADAETGPAPPALAGNGPNPPAQGER
jgi:DNA-binding transcriptional MerR regulator